MARTIRVQPIQGKFVSVTSNGKTIKIYLVDPMTMKQGTEVSYEDAITLLALRHPVVCLSQEKDKNGKFIEQFTEEDWKYVEKKHNEVMNKIATNTLQETQTVSSDNSALEKLVETQAKLIEAQNKQLEQMTKDFANMQKNVDKLMKKNKGKDKDVE